LFLDEEDRKAIQQDQERIFQIKRVAADKRKEYDQKMKETTTKTFTDRPDTIDEIKLLHCTPDSFAIEWKKPCDNNILITHFKVYLKTQEFDEFEPIGDLAIEEVDENGNFCYEVTGLLASYDYYIIVNAINAQGEGYRPKYGQFVRTMSQDMYNTSSLYVWGNNESSELGLPEELITEGVKEPASGVEKNKITKPVKGEKFNQMVY